MFNGDWYLRRNEDVSASDRDTLGHFVVVGRAEQHRPNHYFDPNWYRLHNCDEAAAAVDPLLHYIRDGATEGRQSHPLFNPGWYHAVYVPDEAEIELGHFLAHRKSGHDAPIHYLIATYNQDEPASG